MIQVLSKPNEKYRYLDELCERKIYAFVDTISVNRIVKYDNYKFTVICESNTFEHWGNTYNTLERAVEFALADYTVYEFNSVQEYLEWALEIVKMEGE